MPSSGVSPVDDRDRDRSAAVEQGIAICLSGGGYRAMLFHVGVVWRLLEMGWLDPKPQTAHFRDGTTAILGSLQRVSSVSGGSITSALLALRWSDIRAGAPNALDRFQSFVVDPLRRMAEVTIAGAATSGVFQVVKNILLPGSVSDHVAKSYAKHLFGDATLKNLPDEPRFVINASNLQSGALWRFAKPYVRDWRVGKMTATQKVTLAKAVAASSAFPPVLAPATFSFDESDYEPNSGGLGNDNLQFPPYTTKPILADGGVYDNLGLETVYKRYRTLLVSNSGAPFDFVPNVPRNWAGLGSRVISLIDNQVCSLRKRLLVNAFTQKERLGVLLDIDQTIGVHGCLSALPCDRARTLELAQVKTDLAKKEPQLQERLINWGYALSDAAIRGHLDVTAPAPGGFPYPVGV